MMTVKKLDSVKQARSYYQAERGVASYYSSEANAYGGGQWYGRGAEELGLRGPVHERQWNRALEGRFGKGEGAFQVGNPDPEQRRPGVDLTFSPPKSVSIVALAVGDDRLIAAHDRAVERAMARVEEQHAFARMGHGGAEKVLTGNVAAALYRHVTDRPVDGVTDPQLHTHAVILNVTQRPDGQWVSVNLGMSKDWIKASGAVYRMELAKEIRALGYELYETKDGFEIKGVSRETIERFSGRSSQIEKELARQGKTRATATAAEKDAANLATRKGKEARDGAELRAEWRERARRAGLIVTRESAAAAQKHEARTSREGRGAPGAPRPLLDAAFRSGDGLMTPQYRRSPRDKGKEKQRRTAWQAHAGAGMETRAIVSISKFRIEWRERRPIDRASPAIRAERRRLAYLLRAANSRIAADMAASAARAKRAAKGPPARSVTPANAWGARTAGPSTPSAGGFGRARSPGHSGRSQAQPPETSAKEVGGDGVARPLEDVAPLYAEAVARGPLPAPDPTTVKALATEGVQAAVRHLSERESAFERDAILVAAQGFLPAGLVTGPDLEQAMRREHESCRLLDATEGRYTTGEAIIREQEFIARIQSGRDAVLPIASNTPAVLQTSDGKTLNTGQTNAARHILETPDRFVAVQGVAGAGKTTAMQVVREQAEAAAYKVVGMAPMHKSAQELRDAGISNTYTIARATASMPQEIDDTTLIIVDESSMVGAETLADLTEKIEKTGARAVFVGDTRQLAAVEAGAPFRQMQDHAQTAVLDEIQRQKNPELKAAVEAFAAGRSGEGANLAKPFMREVDLSSLKNMRFENPHAQRVAEESLIAGACAEYLVSLPREERADHMVITGTNDVRREINADVRTALQERGELSTTEVTIKATEKLDFTREQIRHAGSYTVGHIVEFRRDYQSHGVSAPVDRAHQYQITAIDRDHNKLSLVDRENGQRIEWAPQIAQKATISKPFDLTVSEGDRVYFRAHDPDRGIVNGDRGTVQKIEGGRVEVATDRGKLVEVRLGEHVEHAYCVTTNSAQSATTGTPIMGHHAGSPTASAQQGYVGLSRGRVGAVVFTNSKDDLAKAWAKSKPKETAHEVCLDDLDKAAPQPDRATERAREAESPSHFRGR